MKPAVWAVLAQRQRALNELRSLENDVALWTIGGFVQQTPSVGRVVHYFDRDEQIAANDQNRRPQPYAAIITRVRHDKTTGDVSDRVDLAVFDPELGYQFKRDVLPQSDEQPVNSWAWPPFLPSRGASTLQSGPSSGPSRGDTTTSESTESSSAPTSSGDSSSESGTVSENAPSSQSENASKPSDDDTPASAETPTS